MIPITLRAPTAFTMSRGSKRHTSQSEERAEADVAN